MSYANMTKAQLLEEVQRREREAVDPESKALSDVVATLKGLHRSWVKPDQHERNMMARVLVNAAERYGLAVFSEEQT